MAPRRNFHDILAQSSTPYDTNVTLARLDRVRLSSGQILIVTGYHPNRPKNCWSGVIESGHGKEYIFGNKHRPVKIGVVTEDHPALKANSSRKGPGGAEPDAKLRALVNELLKAIEEGNPILALSLAKATRAVLEAGA